LYTRLIIKPLKGKKEEIKNKKPEKEPQPINKKSQSPKTNLQQSIFKTKDSETSKRGRNEVQKKDGHAK